MTSKTFKSAVFGGLFFASLLGTSTAYAEDTTNSDQISPSGLVTDQPETNTTIPTIDTPAAETPADRKSVV